MIPTTEIFIVSFKRDAEFLRYALRSIEKFATGFTGITVLVPRTDFRSFEWVHRTPSKLRFFDENPNCGMLHHQAKIIEADIWCPNAETILFMDSDCMFWEPVTPADYFVDGRPVLYRERYATLTNKLRLNWKEAVFNATGIDPEWETMCRHPAVHLRETIAHTRQRIETHTGKSSEDYILSCRNDFPQTFAEFPTLGAVAITHFSARYNFVDYDVTTPDGGYDYRRGKDRMTAHWSHGGIEAYRAACEEILR